MNNNEKPNHTILLVEDDIITSKTETELLTRAGYKIVQAFNGESAIEITSSNRNSIDLILMDINLGDGIDGIDTAREILRTNNIPIIFLSTYTDEQILKRIEGITTYGYMIKNLNTNILTLNIKIALNRFILHEKLKYKLEWYEMFRFK